MTTPVPGVTDVEAERGHAVAMLAPYAEYRQAEKEAKGSKDMAGKLIRGYLDGHPDETLTDGEHDIRAFMRPSKGSVTLSTGKMDAALLMEVIQEPGLMKVNPKVLATLSEVNPHLAASLLGFIGTGEGATSLQVVKEDRNAD